MNDPLQPHTHEPNPEPPSADASFTLVKPDGTRARITPAALEKLPRTAVPDCYIVSTGHGTSGPFLFGGVTLLDLVQHYLVPGAAWSQVEVISADGFGNRVTADELRRPQPPDRPILLSDSIDGQTMSRAQGLVRLIVPGEIDDALRQVKWVGKIIIRT